MLFSYGNNVLFLYLLPATTIILSLLIGSSNSIISIAEATTTTLPLSMLDDGNNTTTTGPFQDRCGYGPRLPMLVISSWAKVNFVDHTIIDQTSILRFIEDNWNLGRIGNHSYDEKAGSILNMFNFDKEKQQQRVSPLFLDPNTGLSISAR
jgi:hypothetical protein